MRRESSNPKAEVYLENQSKFELDALSSKRLNLNDLLKRRKEEKEKDNKFNLKIISGVFVLGLVLVTFVIL